MVLEQDFCTQKCFFFHSLTNDQIRNDYNKNQYLSEVTSRFDKKH